MQLLKMINELFPNEFVINGVYGPIKPGRIDPNAKKLRFDNYNYPIEKNIIPNCVTHLTLCSSYGQKFNEGSIPPSVTHLFIRSSAEYLDYILNSHIPDTVKHLVLSHLSGPIPKNLIKRLNSITINYVLLEKFYKYHHSDLTNTKLYCFSYIYWNYTIPHDLDKICSANNFIKSREYMFNLNIVEINLNIDDILNHINKIKCLIDNLNINTEKIDSNMVNIVSMLKTFIDDVEEKISSPI